MSSRRLVSFFIKSCNESHFLERICSFWQFSHEGIRNIPSHFVANFAAQLLISNVCWHPMQSSSTPSEHSPQSKKLSYKDLVALAVPVKNVQLNVGEARYDFFL